MRDNVCDVYTIHYSCGMTDILHRLDNERVTSNKVLNMARGNSLRSNELRSSRLSWRNTWWIN
jgi:hypothetical protein